MCPGTSHAPLGLYAERWLMRMERRKNTGTQTLSVACLGRAPAGHTPLENRHTLIYLQSVSLRVKWI